MEKSLGPVIGRRGGDVLRISRVEDGRRYGCIVTSDGEISPEMNVDSVLARGYWEPVQATPTAALKAYLKAHDGPGK